MQHMTPNVVEMPPRGYYLAHEVGQLVGVSGDRVGQWMRRGYIRASVSKGPPHVYAFQDVAEAMVVHDLEQRGVPLRVIKAAIQRERDRTGRNWPLTNARLSIPLDSLQERVLPAALIVHADQPIDVGADRPALELDLLEITSTLERGGWAARELPDLQLIEVDPDRMSGRPVVRGTRVPAEDVARLAATAAGRRTLRDDYDLDDDQIAEAVRWWDAVRRYEARPA